jgi:transporter family-2 protein
MPLSTSLLAALGILSGVLLAVQAPINAQAGSALHTPLAAATLSFFVGTAALLLATLVFSRHAVHLSGLRSLPPYVVFGGGLLGACYVTAIIILAPRLGVAALVSLAIAGQLAAGLVLDHFGLLGLAERSLSPGRAVGVALVFAGALMVKFL